jgi:hypothetical protein
MRDVLVNSAVDERPTRAIFYTICGVQLRVGDRNGTATARLGRMAVQVEVDGRFRTGLPWCT